MSIGCYIIESAWLNTIKHLKGNHDNCLIHRYTTFVWDIGIQYDEAAQKLFAILDKRTKDFDLIFRNATTNFNESFHLEQLKFGSKSISFPKSQIIRYQLSVLHPQFVIELRDRFGLPKLDQENELKLIRNHNCGQDKLETRKTFEYRQKDKIYRREKKEKNKKNKKGDYRTSTDSDEYSDSYKIRVIK